MKRHQQSRAAHEKRLESREDVRGRERETHYRQEAPKMSPRWKELEAMESDAKAKNAKLSEPDTRELAEYRREGPFRTTEEQASLARREPSLNADEKVALKAWRTYGDLTLVELEVKAEKGKASAQDKAELEVLKRTGNRRHARLTRLKVQAEAMMGKSGAPKLSAEELIELEGLDKCDGDSVCAQLYKTKFVDKKLLLGCDLKEYEFVEKRAHDRAKSGSGANAAMKSESRP